MYITTTVWTYNENPAETKVVRRESTDNIPRSNRIQFSLEDSPFHKELIKQIRRKGKNTEKIMHALDDLEFKTNWDNWDLELENMALWVKAYNYSDDPEWRLWLADCLLVDILNEEGNVTDWDLLCRHEVINLYAPELKQIEWPENLKYIYHYLYESKQPTALAKDNGLGHWGWFLYHPDTKLGTGSFDKLLKQGIPEFDCKELSIILNCCPEINSLKLFKKYVNLFKGYSDNQASVGIDLVPDIESSNVSDLQKLAVYFGYLIAEGTDSRIDDILTPETHAKFSQLITANAKLVSDWLTSISTEELDEFLLRLDKEPKHYKNDAAKINPLALYLYSELRREVIAQPALAALLDVNNYKDLLQASDFVHNQDLQNEVSLVPLPEIR